MMLSFCVKILIPNRQFGNDFSNTNYLKRDIHCVKAFIPKKDGVPSLPWTFHIKHGRVCNMSEQGAFLGNEVSSGLIGESRRYDGSLQESSSSNIRSNMIGPLQNNI